MAEILGAVAAGTQLCELAATALLKTVRLVKDLQDVPKKMVVLLQDVEKSTTGVQGIFSVVLQPGSKVLEQLDATQFGNLSKATTDLRQAMDEVIIILKPLVGTQSSGKGKAVQRLWKSIMTVKAEKDVMEKLERIDRLNNEFDRHLGIASLELQATISDKLDRARITSGNDKAELTTALETNGRDLQVTICEKHTAITSQLTSISSSTRDSHQTITEVRSCLTETKVDLSRIAEETSIISRQIATLTGPERPEPISREQLRDLFRDELLSVLTGQTDALSASSQMTSRNLSQDEQRSVQEGARHQLLLRPSSLAEATAGLHRDRLSTTGPCQCKVFRRYRSKDIWRLTFRAEEINQHQPGCPYSKSGVRSWSYSARAGFAPFLHSTLELAIGATMKGRSWSMAPPLRFYGTVKRSESPLFQAFDRLPGLIAKKVLRVPWGFVYRQDMFEEYVLGIGLDTGSFFWFTSWQMKILFPEYDIGGPHWHTDYYVEWDVDLMKHHLANLCRQIRLEIEQGRASGADSDEQGRTVLFVSCIALWPVPH